MQQNGVKDTKLIFLSLWLGLFLELELEAQSSSEWSIQEEKEQPCWLGKPRRPTW